MEGTEPKMPGAPKGIQIMTPQQFVAKAGDMPGEESEEGVAEGLPQTLRKFVPGYAKREIDKKMDAGKFGKTDADKDAYHCLWP